MEKQAGRFTCECSTSASSACVENSSKPGPIPREQMLPALVVSLGCREAAGRDAKEWLLQAATGQTAGTSASD